MSKQLIVDGTLIEVEDGTTLMHACEAAGSVIPRDTGSQFGAVRRIGPADVS